MSSNIESTDIEPTGGEAPVQRKASYYPIIIICAALVAVIVGGSIWGLLMLAPQSHNKAITSTPIVTSGTQIPENVSTATSTIHKSTPSVATTATAVQNGAVTPGAQASPTVGAATVPIGGSALLYGTNLSLIDSSDQVLTSAATRTLLQQIHPGIVRIPMRSNLPVATIVQAAQIVKSIGAAPMIILSTLDASDPSALTNDTQVVTDMKTIFGSSPVYYEYGNEPDLVTGDPTPYTTSWNQVVPQLKKLAPTAYFVGPAMYLYDFNYLKNFLAKANPLPDFVSWHEYTCGSSWPAATCISHIDNWTNHISGARSVMTAAIGKTLPIMITEWNYTADHSVAGDGKNDNPNFMTTWTTKALQVLAANGIYAAMQYSCTDAQVPLITPANTLTPQGTVFQSQPH